MFFSTPCPCQQGRLTGNRRLSPAGGGWGWEKISNAHLLIFITLLFFSCEEFSGWRIKPQEDNRLVVEAILTNEVTTQKIKLSQTYTIANGKAPAVTDAIVQVEANGVVYEFQHDTVIPGTYKSKSPFAVVDHLPYTLTIDWEESVYSASSELSAVSPIPEIRFDSLANTDSVSIREFAQIFNPNQQAMYEVTADWSHLTDTLPDQAIIYYYTFSFVHVNELIRPPREKVYFPIGSQVIAKKYGLNEDFVAFLRAMLIETDWSGNFYFVASGDLPGNISGDAQGFFTTCAVLSDTLIAE